MSESLQKITQHLEKISYRGVNPGLDRIREALQLLGDPQKKYAVVHIAGTNGKGSVCSLLAQIFALSGYKTGLSLSPHILDYRERMQFSDSITGIFELADEEILLKCHEKILRDVTPHVPLTYFEHSIALALLYFSEVKAEVCILETGMGGRWDATNVCDSVFSGVVTVGLDHMIDLGDTLEKITREKIAIAKPGTDFLFGPRAADLVDLAKNHCQKVGVRFHAAEIFSDELKCMTEKNQKKMSLMPQTFRENFNFSLCAAKILSKKFNLNLEQFLLADKWNLPPARFDILVQDPMLVVDGAHNEPALTELKKHIATLWGEDYNLVYGCLADRDFEKLAELILPRNGNAFWCVFDGGGRQTPLETYRRVQGSLGGEICEIDDALMAKIFTRSKPVLVCGSLYLCGQFITRWRKHG